MYVCVCARVCVHVYVRVCVYVCYIVIGYDHTYMYKYICI